MRRYDRRVSGWFKEGMIARLNDRYLGSREHDVFLAALRRECRMNVPMAEVGGMKKRLDVMPLKRS